MARTKITSKPSLSHRWRLAAAGVAPPRKSPIKKMMSARRSAPGTGGMKLRRKCKAGVKAIREIEREQKNAECLIPRSRFCKVVKEIINFDLKLDKMVTELAYIALQEAAEEYLTDLFEEMVRASVHAGRQTVQHKDLQFALSSMKRGATRYR